MSANKILFLGKLPPPYIGPSIATEILLKSKLKNNFELIHLNTSDHRKINSLGRIDFWNIYLALKHYVVFIWKILTKCPDLVYMPVGQTTISYFRDAGFILLAKLFRKKVVCHLRGGNFRKWHDSGNFLKRYLIRKIHRLVDSQIVLGNNLKGLFRQILPENKIFVVPNGGNFGTGDKKKGKSDKVRILYLANFHRAKGVLDVLKSIPYVYHHYKNIEYVFVGSWRDQETKHEFERFIRNNSNYPIILKGTLCGNEKFQLYSTSDIFVFPTYYPPEGHPWVIVEAMASGLPVISTDQGAITESVIDGVNGFIVSKKVPKQIAEKTIYLLDHPNIRREMGVASRRHYLNNFTEDKMVEKMSLCFKSVLKM